MMAGPGSHLPALAFDDGGHVLGRDAVEVQGYLARRLDRRAPRRRWERFCAAPGLACREPGCGSVWRDPPHERGTG